MMNTKVSPAEWVGRLIDQRFPLFDWLGSAESGELFRTELPGPRSQKAAIRLVPAEIDGAQAQFDDWAQAEGLSHPNLLRIFDSGHGRIDEYEFLYVVTELPEESLAQVLPARSLSGPEAGEMLPPILDALAYLHGKGLVHGRVSPANILVVEDRVKLSADTTQHSGRLRRFQAGMRLYEAPEIVRGAISPESDIWSLGITLVEALTQLPPMRNATSGEPGVPQFMPEPFAEIARQCLRIDPAERATIDEIRLALRVPPTRTAPVPLTAPTAPAPAPMPAARAAAAAPPPSPIPNPPRAPEPEPPQGSLSFDEIMPSPRSLRSGEEEVEIPRSKPSMPLIAGLVALLVVLIAALFIRSHKNEPAPPQETQTTATAPIPQAPAVPAPATKPRAAAAPARKQLSAPVPAPQATAPAQAAPPPGPVKASGGAVEERVMPEDRAHGERTIHGKVTVRVRVEVDREGRVSNASFESEGPSRYFGKIALEAARKWRFRPPQSNGGAQSSAWILRFEFRRGRTDVSEVEVGR
jgi:TonB family protein